MQGDAEAVNDTEDEKIKIYDIPQTAIQKLLLGDDSEVNYVTISEEVLTTEEEQARRIEAREKELAKEIKALQKTNKTSNTVYLLFGFTCQKS